MRGDAKAELTFLNNFLGSLYLTKLGQGSASTLLYYLTSFCLRGSCSVCCPILGPVIVSLCWCWDDGVVDWDWPQLQTALSYFSSFTSLNFIGENRRSFCKGIAHFVKEKLVRVDSPLSLGYMKDILNTNWFKYIQYIIELIVNRSILFCIPEHAVVLYAL